MNVNMKMCMPVRIIRTRSLRPWAVLESHRTLHKFTYALWESFWSAGFADFVAADAWFGKLLPAGNYT